MDQKPAINRVWSLDIIRGLFIFLMVLGHSIFFFHSGINPVLQAINGFADMVSFTGLLLISGATGYIAYIHYSHPHTSVIKRMSKRLFMYLLGYYVIAIFAFTITSGWSWQAFFDILTFQQLVPFTEFILAFIIFGFIKIPFRSYFDKLSRNPAFLVLLGFAVYFGGMVLYQIEPEVIPVTWKALLVGHQGVYSFPVFQYMPIYLVGIFVGRQIYSRRSPIVLKKIYGQIATIATILLMGSLATAFVSPWSVDQIFNRFPPTIPFLLVGITLTLWIKALLHQIEDLKHTPTLKSFLMLLGQNAFAVFFTHTFIVYSYVGFGFPLIHGSLLITVLWAGSIWLALYLSKIIPLNYTFGLTVYHAVEDHHLTKSEQHRIVSGFKKLFDSSTHLDKLFTVKIGSRRIRVFRKRNLAIGFIILLLAATQLGVAENIILYRTIAESLQGQVSKQWLLTSDNQVTYSITLPDSINQGSSDLQLLAQLSDQEPVIMALNNEIWSANLPTSDIDPGSHQIHAILKNDSAEYHSRPSQIRISHPLYITWTIDWEGYDVSDAYLTQMADIADSYNVPMTHLFNPRIYFTDEITPQRAEFLTSWVRDRLSQNGETIGLHLHMFPDMVEAAGINPILDPVWGGGFSPGYDVMTTNYGYNDMVTILEFAKAQFPLHQLPEPATYRAGAWFANTQTLRALQDTGFVADTSARTAYQFGTNNVKGYWNVSPTTQPYYPSITNQNSSKPPPTLSILEIPNNGADSFEYSSEEMIDRFTQNFNNQPLNEPKQITYLSHPHWFKPSRQSAMRQVFEHISQYHKDTGNGPVEFVSLEEVYQAFK